MKTSIRLHNDDNIVIALKDFEKGSCLELNTGKIILQESIKFGHKIAIVPISRHSKILKYGLSIGSATKDICAGAHVHSHNLKTDYVASQQK
ncbi:UxaA family hydrolase [uncultured Polaribacter sp.]|uniref:UxaA family hydrolase n=1 Tax=uncultured Polaribacter sp. TaxID=174711 RepID=UPI0026367464|nr:UxaA family hydrolase [uncultured Polaribacter sp.]